MRFDLMDLRLFVAIVEAGSISKGAEAAHLALASASARVSGMEATLGVSLLDRGRRGVVPASPTTSRPRLRFIEPDVAEWQVAVDRMEDAGFPAVPSFNPFWDQLGRSYEDPDGYRVVIQNAAWNT